MAKRIDRNHPMYWKPLDVPYVFEDRPLWFHKAGLAQTATGYGSRLTSSRVVRLESGETRRVYVTQFSNVGTAWVVFGGTIRLVREV